MKVVYSREKQDELTLEGTFKKGPFGLAGIDLNGKILFAGQNNPEKRFGHFTAQLFDKAVPAAIKSVGKAENTTQAAYQLAVWLGQTSNSIMFLFW